MLADEDAAVGDQLVGAFLLSGLVIPGTGEGHVHGDRGAHGLGTQIEGGIAGDNLGIGESAYIAHLGLILGDVTVGDHVIELHTGGNASQVTALIDGGEGVVVIAQALGVSLGAGGVAELHIGELLGSLDHVVLVTEGVGKDDVAAVIGQLSSLVVALLTLGNVGDDRVLHAQLFAGFLSGVDEVQVIGGVLIMEHDEADLKVGSGLGGSIGLGLVAFGIVIVALSAAAGGKGEDHRETQEQRKKLLHFNKSSSN